MQSKVNSQTSAWSMVSPLKSSWSGFDPQSWLTGDSAPPPPHWLYSEIKQHPWCHSCIEKYWWPCGISLKYFSDVYLSLSVGSVDWWYRYSTCMVRTAACMKCAHQAMNWHHTVTVAMVSYYCWTGVEDYPYYNMLDDLEFKEAVKEFSWVSNLANGFIQI